MGKELSEMNDRARVSDGCDGRTIDNVAFADWHDADLRRELQFKDLAQACFGERGPATIRVVANSRSPERDMSRSFEFGSACGRRTRFARGGDRGRLWFEESSGKEGRS